MISCKYAAFSLLKPPTLSGTCFSTSKISCRPDASVKTASRTNGKDLRGKGVRACRNTTCHEHETSKRTKKGGNPCRASCHFCMSPSFRCSHALPAQNPCPSILHPSCHLCDMCSTRWSRSCCCSQDKSRRCASLQWIFASTSPSAWPYT